MYHVIKTTMVCSKCNSKNIVAPCNEPEIDFRCLDCGHERLHKTEITVSGGTTTYEWNRKKDCVVEI